MKKIDENVNLFDLNIFSKSKKELLKKLEKHLHTAGELLVIFTPNPEQIMLAKRSKSFAVLLGFADILVPDGVGLVLAAKVQAIFSNKRAITERITGIDLTTGIMKIAGKQQKRILLVGGQEYGTDTQTTASQELTINGQTVFWLPGYTDVTKPSPEEEALVAEQLKKLRPAVVFVAFGAPKQEEWVYKHRKLLSESDVQVVMVVGGAFDMLLGKVKRAPQIVRTLGLEWLYRLMQEPWRARRQLQLISFVGLMLKTTLASVQSKKP